MLSVTKAAGAYLAQKLEDQSATGCVLRLVIAEKSAILTVDQEKPRDVSYRHQDKTVLVFDPDVARQLESNTLDLDQSHDEPQLKLK